MIIYNVEAGLFLRNGPKSPVTVVNETLESKYPLTMHELRHKLAEKIGDDYMWFGFSYIKILKEEMIANED